MTLQNQDKRSSDEAKRWLIVGAYQAGASEKMIARISGLSRTAVRQIILNFRQTGNPSIPERIPRRVKEKPVVEYDENGNLIDDDDDDDEDDRNSVTQQKPPTKRKAGGGKITSSRKIARIPTTRDVIAYAAEQLRRSEERLSYLSLEPLPPLPGSPSSSVITDTPSLSSTASSVPQWRPLTPPRDFYALPPTTKEQHIFFSAPNNQALHHLPPSPPMHGQRVGEQDSSMEEDEGRERSVQPLPPPGKFDQTIRGYEIWTHEDDMILMRHVLNRLEGSRWRQLEAKFEGRHSARLCQARWHYLRKLLLKGLEKPVVLEKQDPTKSIATN